MYWIKEYAKSHRLGICLYVVFGIVFAAVLWLYRLPVEPVAYALGLCIVIALLVMAVDFGHYRKRAEELKRQMEAARNAAEKLPEPKGGLEELYQKLLENAREGRSCQVAMLMREKMDVTDYFTLWAHQIKTPIAAMRLLLQQELSEPEEYYGQRREAEAELFKIEQYVEMALAYLRTADMTSDFVFEQYDLDSIIRQAVKKYSQMFILQDVKLNYKPVERRVLTDEKWLAFVIEQLLSNALKYTGQKEHPAISIYTEGECLVIEDTGIGIWAEDLPRVFEKGFTGYNGREDKKSTGIGLYLCKTVTDKLRHEIRLDSEVGKGTKAYIGFGRRTERIYE